MGKPLFLGIRRLNCYAETQIAPCLKIKLCLRLTYFQFLKHQRRFILVALSTCNNGILFLGIIKRNRFKQDSLYVASPFMAVSPHVPTSIRAYVIFGLPDFHRPLFGCPANCNILGFLAPGASVRSFSCLIISPSGLIPLDNFM